MAGPASATGLPVGPSAIEGDSVQRPLPTVLDEVRVTARWDVGAGKEFRLPNQRIDLNAQRALGVTSASEALAFHPSLRVSRDAMIGTSVQIGAMPASSTLVLVDGVPVTGRTDGRIDLSTLSTLGLDRVEIVTGPMAHFYGSGAAAGVVNLLTKHSRNEAQAQASVSSIGEWQHGVRIATPKLGNFYAERQFFDGWDPNPEGKRSRAWDQKTTYNLRQSGQFRTKNWIARHHVSGSWDQIKDRGDRRSPYTAFATDRWIETWRGRIQGDAWHPNWQVTAAYDAADRSITRYNRNLVERTQIAVEEPGNPDLNRFGDGMLRVAHLGSWQRIGIGSRKTTWRGVAAYHGQVQYISAARMKESEMKQFQHGFLGEWDLKTDGKLLELGLRGQWIPSTWAWNPSVQWTQRTTKGDLRLNASGGFRAPELKERFLWFFDASHQIEGNPNLQPERSRQIGASWTTQKKGGLEAQIVELRQAIQLARQSGGTYTYVNIDSWSSAHISGSVAFRQGKIEHDVRAQALWSRLGSETWRPSPSVGLRSTFPMGPLTATYQHQTQWGLWIWSQNTEGELSARQLGLTHNGQASLQWKRRRWSIAASGHNLWNQTTAGVGGHATGLSGLPMPGRHYRISLNFAWN